MKVLEAAPSWAVWTFTGWMVFAVMCAGFGFESGGASYGQDPFISAAAFLWGAFAVAEVLTRIDWDQKPAEGDSSGPPPYWP